MPTTNPNKPDQVPPYKVTPRPGGDFAVQRFIGGRIQRWGVYAERAQARTEARFANAGDTTRLLAATAAH